MPLNNIPLLHTGIFIYNHWVESPGRFPVYDPATHEKLADVSEAGETDCLRAIQAAEAAFPGWSRLSAGNRAAMLRKWHALIMQHSNELAMILTSEQGKPLSEARAEIQYGASFIEWNAEECRRSYGEVIPAPVATKRMFTIKQPIGVVAAITPWNFPVAMITRKIAPALAAGCTVVLKPAEDTPLSALALAQLAMEAGLPPGVLNVLPCSNPAVIGRILCTHPAIRKVSFTGSTEVGRLLMEQVSSTVKRMSLELGGNAPVIVFDDASLELAVKGALASKYRNAGQTCVCANRIYVQRGIHDRFVEQYTAAVEKLKVGPGVEQGVDIGPLINEDGVNKVKRLLFDAKEKGASIVTGGEVHEAGELFFQPTVVTACDHTMLLSKEEIFGPVSSIFVFDTEEEAIRLANDTEYGLAAYIFTENIHRGWRVAEQVEYGIIGLNEGLISHAEAPFGGMKQSGFGKEGSHYGLEEYLETKYLCLGGF